MLAKEEELRFFQDAEFAQALANIDYVLWLSKQGYFEHEAFINYLKYLQYLAEPEYAVHLCFPRGLEILQLLGNDSIRSLLSQDPLSFRRILMDQTWSSWGRKAEADLA
jgi:mediator of RNA polymerase II transcription subunit 31